MLTCLLNNQRIDCCSGKFSRDELKKWASKRILLCPACGKPYEYCHGKVKTPYFRHMDKAECEDRFSESETEEHIIGKRDLYEWIKKQKYVTDCVLEGWLPETKQRPDIMFKYKGQLCVIEYQCSPIASEYIERHNLYQAAGIKDIWVAGIEKYKQPNMRHKFLDDCIEGYYDVKTKEFWVGDCSTQNRYLYNIKFPRICNINDFKFNEYTFIHKYFFDKNLLFISELRKNREKLKYKDYINSKKNKQKLINLAEKYFSDLSKKYFLSYDYDSISVYKMIFIPIGFYGCRINKWKRYDEKVASFPIIKNNFYKELYDIKFKLTKLKEYYSLIREQLEVLNQNTKNTEWYFYLDSDYKINVSLLDEFNCVKNIGYNDIDLENKDNIKFFLLPMMKQCLHDAKTGNKNIRVMEVRED